jgi:tetratricopeptide (TPR) repeat protein
LNLHLTEGHNPAPLLRGEYAVYDAFISYSHALDKPVAAALQSIIQTLGKPWWRRRVSRVFRDDTSLSATPGLWPSIEEALTSSRFLVLLASPESAKSKWVTREVARWLECKGSGGLLIALTAGELIWDEDLGDFRPTTDPPISGLLRGHFRDEPLWIDLREARAAGQVLGKTNQAFLASCASIVAAIRGLPKEDVLSEEVTQQRRNLMWARGAVLTLLLLTATAIWQANRATTAQHVAEAQRDRAQRALNQVIATANRRVLTLSLRLQEDASRANPGNQPTTPTIPLEPRDDGPDHDLHVVLEETQRSDELAKNGDDIGALKYAESAVAMLEAGAGPRSRDAGWQLARLGSHDRMAQIEKKLGDTARASAELSKNLNIAQRLAKEDPDNKKWLQALAVIHQELGDLGLDAKRFSDAESHYRSTLELRTQIAGFLGNSVEARREQAIARSRLGNLLVAEQKFAQAIEPYREGEIILESLVNSSPSNTELQRDLSVSYQHLADALTATGRFGDALGWLQKDISVTRTLSEVDLDNLHRQRDLASSYERLGRLLEKLDRANEALEIYAKSVGILEAIVAKDPSQSAWQRDAAVALENMGKLTARLGNPHRAVDNFRRALSWREQLAASFEEDSWQHELELAYRRTSELILSMGQPPESLETAEQYLLATSLAPDQKADKPERVARALGTVCWSALFARDFSRGLWAGREAVALAPRLDWVKLNYAHALMFSDHADEAAAIYLGESAQGGEMADKWRNAILKDFAELKSKGLSHKQMDDIERRVKH